MSTQTVIGDSRSPLDGFFGKVGAALETSVTRIGTDILPNWVGTQLGMQSEDMLLDPMYTPDPAQPRIEGQAIQSTDSNGNGTLQKIADFQVFRFGNMNITGGQVILMGAVLFGLVFVLKKT